MSKLIADREEFYFIGQLQVVSFVERPPWVVIVSSFCFMILRLCLFGQGFFCVWRLTISTAADLIALGETPEHFDKHFIIIADIDLDPNLPGRKVFNRDDPNSGGSGSFDIDDIRLYRL
jgi:hypothetical protein